MKIKKILSIYLTILLLFLLIGFILPFEASNMEEEKKASKMTWDSSQIVYEKIERLGENWSPDAKLILIWAVECPYSYIFPDEFYLPPPDPGEERAQDYIIGDSKASIWEFIFFLQNKKALLELRMYLTVKGEWRVLKYEKSTPFDYSSFEIDFSPLPVVGAVSEEIYYLLWRYSNDYKWQIWPGKMEYELRDLNQVIKDMRPHYVYFWESQIPFVLRSIETYPFEPGNGFIGVLVLPDYGEYGNLKSPTYLLSSGSYLYAIYPGKVLKAPRVENVSSAIKATEFRLKDIEDELTNQDFWESIGKHGHVVITYYIFNEDGKDTMVLSVLQGADVSSGISSWIDLEPYENSHSYLWPYILVTGITIVTILSATYAWKRSMTR